jgi:myo-inositol 2-dehydrogenase/D-chiro-inositol 1-dehydrogenase
MTRLKVALIGLGRMGRVHAAALAKLNTVDVVAVADPSEQAIEFARALFPRAQIFASYEQALTCVQVEACLIASPTPLHPQMVRDALLHGLHVLCEKPLALNVELAHELATIATTANLVLQIGHWRRFSPPWATAKKLLDAGSIGAPIMIRLSQWDANSPPASFCDASVSGGLAIDCGVHEYDLAEWFFGSPVRAVRAWNLTLVEKSLAAVGDVDNLCAVLEFDGSRTAFIDLSRNCRYGDDVRTEILGSDGAIYIDLLPTGRTRLATKDGVVEVEGSQVIDATAAGVENQLDAFATEVSVRGSTDLPDGHASARATQIGHAVNLAAKTADRIVV